VRTERGSGKRESKNDASTRWFEAFCLHGARCTLLSDEQRNSVTAKMLASFIPSMVLTWLAGLIFVVGVRAGATSVRVFNTIVSPGWLTVFLVCTPLLALIAIAVMVAISARVNDPRTAQQFSAWVVVPFLAVFFSQLTGVLVLSPLIALVAAIMLAVIAGLAIWGVTGLFQREVILTKWS
jgi:ABC-2 type transport system permease protein